LHLISTLHTHTYISIPRFVYVYDREKKKKKRKANIRRRRREEKWIKSIVFSYIYTISRMITRHLTDVIVNPNRKKRAYFKYGHTRWRSYKIIRTIFYIIWRRICQYENIIIDRNKNQVLPSYSSILFFSLSQLSSKEEKAHKWVFCSLICQLLIPKGQRQHPSYKYGGFLMEARDMS